MAKKKAKTKSAEGSKSKPGSLASRYKALSDSTRWILFILLVIFGVIGYNLTLDALERRKFNEMEKTVDTLVERINRGLGTRTVNKLDNCGYDQEKLGRGHLWCASSSEIHGESINIDDVSSYLLSQTDLISSIKPSFNDYYFVLSSNPDVVCRLINQDKNNYFLIRCSDYARSHYYPIVN